MGDITIQSETISDAYGTRIIALYPSSSGKSFYRVDTTLGTCSCPAWTFQKRALADRLPCKHLISLGFTPGVRRVDQEIVQQCSDPAIPVPEPKTPPPAAQKLWDALTAAQIQNAL